MNNLHFITYFVFFLEKTDNTAWFNKCLSQLRHHVFCVEYILLNPLKIEQQSVYNQRKGVLFFMFLQEIGLKRFIFVMFNLT